MTDTSASFVDHLEELRNRTIKSMIAIGMFTWSFLNDEGSGIAVGLIAAIPFTLLAVALWRAKSKFSNGTDRTQDEPMLERDADSGHE